jgi:hypothetical protein
MNKAQHVRVLSVKVPPNVYQQLSTWPKLNISSLSAELIRSACEREEREQEARR